MPLGMDRCMQRLRENKKITAVVTGLVLYIGVLVGGFTAELSGQLHQEQSALSTLQERLNKTFNIVRWSLARTASHPRSSPVTHSHTPPCQTSPSSPDRPAPLPTTSPSLRGRPTPTSTSPTTVTTTTSPRDRPLTSSSTTPRPSSPLSPQHRTTPPPLTRSLIDLINTTTTTLPPPTPPVKAYTNGSTLSPNTSTTVFPTPLRPIGWKRWVV